MKKNNKIIGLLLIIVAIVSFGVVQTYHVDAVNVESPPITLIFFLVVGGVSSFVLWVLMFRDLVKRGNSKKKWLWGLLLLILYFPGAVIYFIASFISKSEKKYY